MSSIKILGITGKAGSGKSTFGTILQEECGWAVLAFADPLKQWAKDVFDFTDDQLWGPSEERNKPDPRYPRPCFICSRTGITLVEDRVGAITPEYCTACNGEGKTFLAPREVLQRLGTEVGRACYPPIWAEKGLRVAQQLLAPPHQADGQTYLWKYDPRAGKYRVPFRPDAGVAYRALMGEIRPYAGVVFTDVRFETEAEVIHKAGGHIINIDSHLGGLQGEAGKHVSEDGLPAACIDEVMANYGTLDEFKQNIRAFVATLLA